MICIFGLYLLSLPPDFVKMKPAVQWIFSGIDRLPLDYERLEQWISQVAQSYNRNAHTLNYIFCNDDEILDVNRRFLNHDYYTDIITFDSCMGSLLRGDIFISVDTVRSNAEAVGSSYDREMLRVIIHGILHLCGINDKGPGEREIMEAAEDRALAMWDNMD